MAGNFIELEQAAKMLGLTTDQLNDMRLSGDVHAMRDGSGWKFKQDELERVADERGISIGGDDEISLDEDDMFGSGISDLALELEADEEGDSPTVVGASEEIADDTGSGLDVSLEDEDVDDLTVADDSPPSEPVGNISDIDLATEDSELNLEAGSGAVSLDSGNSDIVPGESDILDGTDLTLEGSGVGSGDLDFDGSDLGLVSDLSLEDDDGLALSDDDDFTIGDDDSDLALGEDDDDDLVLDGGSDITAGAGDTGINLAAPTDSGLNLEEEPLDLAGSSVSSLELPEDEDIIDLDDLDADPDEATQLKADDNFDLAPSVAELDADDDDSGSQVIALEDSEAFGGAAMLSGAEPTLGEAEEVDELEGALDDEEIKSVTQPALPDAAMYGPQPEMPYSIWNVLGLLAIVMVLALSGMLMTDLIRNMWSWDSTYSATTPIIDSIVEMLGLDP